MLDDEDVELSDMGDDDAEEVEDVEEEDGEEDALPSS